MNTRPPVKLHYDGRYTFIQNEDNRQWTIVNHWIDPSGADRYRGSFMLGGLIELGIIKSIDKATK